MTTISWEMLLARDWVGCDVETEEAGSYYRGPIAEIKVESGMIAFLLKWCAKKVDMCSPWKHLPNPPPLTMATRDDMIRPMDIGDGRIMVEMPMLGRAVLFPRSVSRLNPAKVENLPVEFAEPNFVDPKN